MHDELAARIANYRDQLRAGARIAPADAAELAELLDRLLPADRGRGQRTAGTTWAYDQRNKLIRQIAAERFGNSENSARSIAEALKLYATTAWLRDRSLDQCPGRLVGKLHGDLWHVLRLVDWVLGEKQIGRVLDMK